MPAEAQPGRVHHSSFSNDGRYFAAAVASNRVRIWETDSGRELTGFKIDDNISGLVVSPLGNWLAVVDGSQRLTMFDRASGQKKVLTNARGHRKSLNYLPAFSRDEKLIAVSSRKDPGGEASLEVWDLATLCRIGAYSGRGLTGAAAFLPGGRSIVLPAGTTPRIWRLDPPTEPDAIAAHIAEAWTVGFSPDAQILATGSDDTRERQTIKLWDPATGRLIAGWTAHTATVTSLAFSPDGRILASASLDSGKPGNHNVILWDARTHQRLANLDGHTDRVRSLAFSPDGRFLATASDDLTARIWEISSRNAVATLSGHSKNLNSIAYSPDGRLIATGSNDATVRLWDIAGQKSRQTLTDVGNTLAVAFAPDGSLLGSANEEGAIKLWNPASGTLMRTIRTDSTQLRCLAFTPDSRNVVAAGKGKVIRVWDIASGQELLSLEGHKAADQRPRFLTQWVDPGLVRPRWVRQALASRANRPAAGPVKAVNGE